MQVSVANGASEGTGQVTAERLAWVAGALWVSLTAMASTVTLPVLVTKKL